MSGFICPDCGLIAFEELILGRLKCLICGWKGKPTTRKIMSGSMLRSKGNEKSRLLALRKQGKLTYFRIHLKGNEDQRWDTMTEIMDFLEVSTISGDELLFFYIEDRISDVKLKLLKKMKYVKKVEYY